MTGLRGEHESHVVSSLKVLLNSEVRKAHKASVPEVHRSLQINVYHDDHPAKLEETSRSSFPELVYRPPLAVDNGQTMLSRLPHNSIGYDPYVEHQKIWTSTVYGYL